MSSKSVSAIVWVLVIAALGGLVFVGAQSGDEPAPETPESEVLDGIPNLDEAPEDAPPEPLGPDTGLLPYSPGSMPDYGVVERSGEEMRTSDLLGKYAVVDFIFTNCPGTCLPMSRAMKDLQDGIAHMDDVRLASFTVDPERDSPEVLAAYADKYGADPLKWLFFFIPKNHVWKITNEHLMIGDGGQVIMHSSKFVLLDPQGRVRGYYDPLVDTGWKDKVLRDLDTLRAEPAGSQSAD